MAVRPDTLAFRTDSLLFNMIRDIVRSVDDCSD